MNELSGLEQHAQPSAGAAKTRRFVAAGMLEAPPDPVPQRVRGFLMNPAAAYTVLRALPWPAR
jgi:hypothetical protein